MTVTRTIRITIALATVAVGLGVTAASGALTAEDRSARDAAIAERSATSGDVHALSRSYGVNPDTARPVFDDAVGNTVSIGRSAQGACLVHTRGDVCRTHAQIAAGDGMLVNADCSTVARAARRMQIWGLVPTGTAEVRVQFNDGTQRTTTAVDGAYIIETATPRPGQAYPTEVDWADAEGRVTRSAAFPYDGENLCVPAPSR